MNKKWTTAAIIVLLLVFIGYMVFDSALRKDRAQIAPEQLKDSTISDYWITKRVFNPDKGQLNAVAVTVDGLFLLGGESFLTCYDSVFNLLWDYKTESPVTALAVSGDKVYAGLKATIQLFNLKGEKVDEWGPFESNSLITSIAGNGQYVAFADAINKTVFILDNNGVVKSLIGKSEDPFIIPSPYFDISLGADNIVYIANTGKWRIERRNIDGKLLGFFGKPGSDPDTFCGCCNPSHFSVIPGGFVTAEKGINRIKILDIDGRFIEFISSINDFVPSVPLDVASADGKLVYAANPADSKLYVFARR